MSLRIQTNTEALNAHQQLSGTNDKLARTLERLSSGYRINRASDDAAGLAISEKLRGQVRGLAQAQRNIGDAISMVQTAEGSLSEVHSMLQRVRELAVQYGNGALSSSDKAALQSEVSQLAADIERIGANTEFNGVKLLNADTSVTFQVGAQDGQTIAASLISLGAQMASGTFTLGGANDLSEIDASINAVSAARSSFGAVQNRLEYTMNNVSAYEENLMAAESRIRDVDMAKEMAELTKYQILSQAGMSMLAQANQSPQAVLSLLKG